MREENRALFSEASTRTQGRFQNSTAIWRNDNLAVSSCSVFVKMHSYKLAVFQAGEVGGSFSLSLSLEKKKKKKGECYWTRFGADQGL